MLSSIQTPFGTMAAICRMIKIEHSAFALPYAYVGAILAAKGVPPWTSLLFLTIAMVAVRSFAMGINRLADLPFDAENPRTEQRPLVTGEITTKQTWAFCGVAALIFILACACINTICLYLSIPALLFSGAYSYTKRISSLCHFWLGATLGLAPLAGWLTVQPEALGMPAILLFFAVMFWVGAFDIYYAFQDYDFDLAFGLYSVPTVYGEESAMVIAGFSHCMTSIFLFLVGIAAGLSWFWYATWLGISLILYWEHCLIRQKNPANIDMAFFTLNAAISFVVFIGVIGGLYFHAA